MRNKEVNFLLDDHEESGNGRKSLLDSAPKFASRTRCEMMDPKRMEFYSVLTFSSGKEQMSYIRITPGQVSAKMLVPKDFNHVYFQPKNKTAGVMKFKTLHNSGLSDEMIREIGKTGFFFMYYNKSGKGTICTVGKSFLAPFCKQIGTGKTAGGANPLRDLYLASVMENAEPFCAISREVVENGHKIRKLFGAFTKDYTTESHNALLDDLPKLLNRHFKDEEDKRYRSVEIGEWSITHRKASVDYVFKEPSPPKTDSEKKHRKSTNDGSLMGIHVEEGIRFTFSDIGDFSYRLQPYVKVGRSISYVGEGVTKRHGPCFDLEKFIESVDISEMKKCRGSLASMYVPVENRNDVVSQLIERTHAANAIGDVAMEKIKRDYLAVEAPSDQTFLDAALMFLQVSSLTEKELKDYAKEKLHHSTGKMFSIYPKIMETEMKRYQVIQESKAGEGTQETEQAQGYVYEVKDDDGQVLSKTYIPSVLEA